MFNPKKLCLFLLIFLFSCNNEMADGFLLDGEKIDWKKVPTKEKTVSELEFLNQVMPRLKTKKIPISVLGGLALYKTNGGKDYLKTTNNPFNIECYEKKCPQTHCVKYHNKKIRNFQNIKNAVEFQCNILIHVKERKNAANFLYEMQNLQHFTSEIDFNVGAICVYIKTYKLRELDKNI